MLEVYTRCAVCGVIDKHWAKTEMLAYNSALSKGWGVTALNTWACKYCLQHDSPLHDKEQAV